MPCVTSCHLPSLDSLAPPEPPHKCLLTIRSALQDLRQACLAEPNNVEYRKALDDVKERIKLRNQV